MKRSIILMLMLFSTVCQGMPAETIRVGIAEDGYVSKDRPFIERTLQQLKQTLSPHYLLEISYLSPGTVLSAVERNQFDVVMMSSADYRKSMLSGTRDIAVLRPYAQANPNRMEGVAFFVDLLNTKALTLSSLKGGKVGMVGDFTVTHRMSMEGALLESTGRPAKHFFREHKDFGHHLNASIKALTSGDVDVLVMPVCTLENLSQTQHINAQRLTVLNAKQDQHLACLHSSALYPSTTFVAMPSLSSHTYTALLAQILTFNDAEQNITWAIATNFSAVDRVLHKLDDDAWAAFRHPTWNSIWDKYWLWISSLALILLLLCYHHLFLGLLVRRKTAELSLALDEQKRLRIETDRTRDRLDKMRRLQTIGQLASLFAHELRQPLNALSCYAYGVRKAITKATPTVQEEAEIGINGLEAQVQRANAIVERVRDYVRSQSSRNQINRLDKIAQLAIQHFQTSSLGTIPISYRVLAGERTTIRCDAMEIELLIVNLLRNAAQAQRKVEKPWIELVVRGGDVVQLTVCDNGPQLSPEDYRNIVSLGETTKPEGLGLGLTIVRDLTEAHHGVVRFSLSLKSSLTVEIDLPSSESDEIL